MKFWKTKEFLDLNKDWYLVLKETGFGDIENGNGFNGYGQRHLSSAKIEIALAFFSALRSYLEENKEIPELERKILELHMQGKKIKDKSGNGIINEVDRCDKTIRSIIKKHRLLILKRVSNK